MMQVYLVTFAENGSNHILHVEDGLVKRFDNGPVPDGIPFNSYDFFSYELVGELRE